MYNSWKRYHCLKYQAIVTPDGLISHLYGPIPGIRYDSLLWQESGMQQVIERYCNTHEGIPMQIYGDPAYKAISPHILSPFDGSSITRQQAKWNKAMSAVRIAVEWCFKEIMQQSSSLNYTYT